MPFLRQVSRKTEKYESEIKIEITKQVGRKSKAKDLKNRKEISKIMKEKIEMSEK